jgi:GDP/UDP-N,N'-diacetylbacillosamine 2-epimerase (hydrolysing)
VSRKICVVTGSRAEYGLLRFVMQGIREERLLELQVVATGTHLSPEFGLTYREIVDDGYDIARRVEMLLSSDTPTGLAKSMGLGLIGFADALAELKPDLLVLLGDRFEVFPAAAAALVARVPVAHISGGETTKGAFDESIRHSITKMSHLHFVAAPRYRDRVLQLGENPENVFLVGGLGADCVRMTQVLDRAELEERLDFELAPRNLLVTFHPVTLDEESSKGQMIELLAALSSLDDVGLIITLPNADTDGRVLVGVIEEFVRGRSNARAYTSLGQERYLSCLHHVDGVVGNSSSGLTEVPSLHKGTVNIGDRQEGRLKASSVIDCVPERQSIVKALRMLFSEGFQESLSTVRNPYGEGGASARIVQVLRDHPLEAILKKTFHDVAP